MHLRNCLSERLQIWRTCWICYGQQTVSNGYGYGHVAVLKFCNLLWCSALLGFVSDSWATCKFYDPNDISGMAGARVVQFCIQVEYVEW